MSRGGRVRTYSDGGIRRHGTTSVRIVSAAATSYIVTMDFNLDGVPESRTITLEDDVHINHDTAMLSFDWRGRLTTPGISLSFEGPSGRYPVQLDVTGSGDVTIGEEKFLDSEVPEVALNNAVSGTGDVSNEVTSLSPTTPPPTTPPITPPTTTRPTTSGRRPARSSPSWTATSTWAGATRAAACSS